MLRKAHLTSHSSMSGSRWVITPLLLSARSQREESHPWQGHAERPDGQGESGLRVSPWNFLSVYPKNQNLPALLYCAFPLFWHTLEKVNSGLQSSAFGRNVSVQTPSDNSLACLRDPYSCACELFSLPTPRGTGSLKHPRNAGTSKVSISLE